ncbi:hypothetical protein ACT8ZV_00175 [Nocardioides sp. MAHUQ-72]|uniref:hypothetical protein n=1 Tax=unclassified Nocardioides TaxID=2615069 RepID=UPI00360F197E
MATYEIPDGLPVLSRGRHRSARKGACFMEMASVLANEPWSDHPKCTHPLLAHLARLVNDHTTDRHRGELVTLIPSVVGLRGRGLPWTVALTADVALRVLPEVPATSERALVAGLVRCDELATALGPGAVEGADAVRQALDDRPDAVRWSRRLAGGSGITGTQFEKRSAPNVMRCAVQGIVAAARNPDECDARLRHLLEGAVGTARRLDPTERSATRTSEQVVLEGEGRRRGP